MSMEFHTKQIGKTLEVLKANGRKRVQELFPVLYLECGYKTSNELPVVDDNWQEFHAGDRVTGEDRHGWFYKKFKSPAAEEETQLYLIAKTSHLTPWDAVNPQCILYLNGRPVQGLDVHHTKVMLEPDTEYEMYCYLHTGSYKEERFDLDFFIRRDSLPEQELYYDLLVPFEAAECFDETNDDFCEIIKPLERAVGMIDFRDITGREYKESLQRAKEFLRKTFYSKVDDRLPIVNCIGHTHIDLAWQWTYQQTREKVQRSFATALELMEQYPEYKFMSSQAQLYQFLKEEAPELYGRVKERISEGRWEAEGAMWVEADCNLSGGESLVRQILYGKQFFRKEFGVESEVLWLPDVFGYSAALPQILRKSGVNYFVTSKISWNEYNKMPYDSFMWKGIDGTEIYSYFLTCQENKKATEDDKETVYNGFADPAYVLGTWRRFQQKDMSRRTLLTYGYGDGGGGPTMQMIERQRRLQYGLPGLPRTEPKFVREFLEQSEKDFIKSSEELNRTYRWTGELYLEKHRGTYTTMAKNKRFNRKSEFLYQNTEKICVTASLLSGKTYPSEILRKGWETILLNQFHDVIPGSSIEQVYRDTDAMYAEVQQQGNALFDDAMDSICANVKTDGGVWVYNPNGFVSDGIIKWNGKTVECQAVPACGWRVVTPKEANGEVRVSGNTIENKWYKVSLDECGEIAALFDKRCGREVVKQGETFNRLMLYEDYPYAWDAWEVSPYYRKKSYRLSEKAEIEPIYDGARAGVKITRRFLNSVIVQYLYLYDNLTRIDIETELDWRERHMLLKAEFPADVNTAKASYEIQFGMIERETHENTSWQQAKFETCAHKWADVSDGGYGVSIINDCKYGHSAQGATLELSLVRGPEEPNPTADLGRHEFTYSILPHMGDFRDAHTVQQAYCLNNPLHSREISAVSGVLPEEFSLVTCDKENMVIDTIKQSENGTEIIIRMYDAYNWAGEVSVKFGIEVQSVSLCDLQENHLNELQIIDDSVNIAVSGFEIVTLAIKV